MEMGDGFFPRILAAHFRGVLLLLTFLPLGKASAQEEAGLKEGLRTAFSQYY